MSTVLKRWLTAMTLSESVPKLVIWVSSTSVYGDNNGELGRRAICHGAAESFSGKLLLAGRASTLLTYPVPARLCVFRESMARGALECSTRFEPAKGVLPSQEQWSNRIHSEDCGAVLAHLVRRFVDGVELDGSILPATQNLLHSTSCANGWRHSSV